jgi:hypothetical protein
MASCGESIHVTGRSPMLDAFPELRHPKPAQARTEPVAAASVWLGLTASGPGFAWSPFSARVIKIERLGELFAVDLEANEGSVVMGEKSGEGCSTRVVGLATVRVVQGEVVQKGQVIGTRDVTDETSIRCKSVRQAS